MICCRFLKTSTQSRYFKKGRNYEQKKIFSYRTCRIIYYLFRCTTHASWRKNTWRRITSWDGGWLRPFQLDSKRWSKWRCADSRRQSLCWRIRRANGEKDRWQNESEIGRCQNRMGWLVAGFAVRQNRCYYRRNVPYCWTPQRDRLFWSVLRITTSHCHT